MRAVLKKELSQHSQHKPEGGLVEAGSCAPKRLQGWRREMAGREPGWRPQLHQLSGQLLPSSGGGHEETVSTNSALGAHRHLF